MRRKSVAATPSAVEAVSEPETTAAIVPTNSTSQEAAPPRPNAKDSPPLSSARQEGVEPAPHPQASDVEGPITTIAEPSSQDAPLSSNTPSEDKLDEISLGGDGDQEDVDLSC